MFRRALTAAVISATALGVGALHSATLPENVAHATSQQDITVDAAQGVSLSDDPAVSAGVCRVFTGRIVVTQCVPLYSPQGGHLVGQVQEDGSAGYSDGYVLDAETREFVQLSAGI